MSDCVKYEEWGNGFISLMVFLAALWLVTGAWFTSPSGVVPTFIYILLYLGWLIAGFFTICPHCYYYGKKCYYGVGPLIPVFMKKSKKSTPISAFIIWGAFFPLVLFYPIFFIARYHALMQTCLQSIGYLAVPLVIMGLILKFCCPHCKEKYCLFNPDRNKGNGSDTNQNADG